METVLEMHDICKTFVGDGIQVVANDHVNFDLKRGELHALLGENGAGKSTLVNCLFHRPDKGEILLNGEKVQLDNPIKALKRGLSISRQDLSKSLIERHTVAENILSISQGFFLSLSKVEEQIRKALEKYNLGYIDPKTKVWKLSGGEKQRIEILKALITDPNIIILDEPTSMLTPPEIENLFELLSDLRKEGKSIVLITHHLEEAINHSDRITVLRNGRVVATLDTAKEKASAKSQDELIRKLATLMVGKEVLYDLNREHVEQGKNVLSVVNLRVKNDMGDQVVNDVSFSLRESSILGLAGISGNGQRELVEGILHWRKVESGEVLLHEPSSNVLNITNKSINVIRDLGIAYIPEDRRKALITDLSIRENLILNSYRSSGSLLINQKQLAEETEELIERFNIKTPSALSPISSLSGGNKQKVVVARETTLKVPMGRSLILIAENPTFGLDVGTTQFVREELLRLRKEGAAILLISSDLTEIFTLCDEIAVIYKGEIMGIVETSKVTREDVGLMMGGLRLSEVQK